MGSISIDRQDLSQTCDHCKERFKIIRGSAYDGSIPFALHLAAMHSCGSGTLLHLAIAVQKGYQDFTETCAVTLDVWVEESEIRMSIIDPQHSPWQHENYLGRFLSLDEALRLSQMKTFFHIADHVVGDNPEISDYLTASSAKPD